VCPLADRDRSVVEAVAHSVHRRDPVAEITELLAEAADVIVNRAVEAVELAAPYAIDQELAVERESLLDG
jgi:hypothetical protein